MGEEKGTKMTINFRSQKSINIQALDLHTYQYFDHKNKLNIHLQGRCFQTR